MIRAEIDGQLVVAGIQLASTGFRLRCRGAELDARVLRPEIADLLHLMPAKAVPDLSRFLLCPMPGQLVRLDVEVGEVVEDGQALAVVEAMKMENVLRAEKRARVSKIRAAAGTVLALDDVILEFEPA